jgi:membrane protease YdiL (CAAX protease family)
MESNLATPSVAETAPRPFPPSNWGPSGAVLGAVTAIVAGLVLGLPALLFTEGEGDLTTAGNIVAQIGLVLGLVGVPLFVARSHGAASAREAFRRLGLRRFDRSAFLWMVVALIAYLVLLGLYSLFVVEPEQEDIAESFGPVPIQVLLIAIAAPFSEELCFRGMLFGGLRERLPVVPAALIAGVVFGLLHAFTGLSAVPPLAILGVIFCLLYEKTGSIVPGILLHALNNSVALLSQ